MMCSINTFPFQPQEKFSAKYAQANCETSNFNYHKKLKATVKFHNKNISHRLSAQFNFVFYKHFGTNHNILIFHYECIPALHLTILYMKVLLKM